MLDKPITIIDIETTGASSANNAITEIGIVKIHDGKIIDEYHTLINPGRKIPSHITRLTGISDATVEDAPYFSEIAHKISEIFNDSYFMAHHVVFDFSFMKRQMKACGYSFSPRLLCSVKLSRAMEPNLKGHSLQKIIERHGINVDARHRALEDAKAVYDFINILVKKYGLEIVKSRLKEQLKYKTLPSNLDNTLLEGVGNNSGVYIFKDDSGTPIYIGKSVNLRSRILSHFSSSSVINKELKISMNTHKLEIINTDSELEALLLESKLIKQLLPLYNLRLRRKRSQALLIKNTDTLGYDTVEFYDGKIDDLTSTKNVLGVYESRLKAKNALIRQRDEYNLCSKKLGLEKTKGSCFRYQLGKCSGACVGEVSPALHNLKIQTAFEKSKISEWKHNGPVLIRISENKSVLINEWRVIRIVESESDLDDDYDLESYDFDYDNYKIINAYLNKNKSNVVLSNIKK